MFCAKHTYAALRPFSLLVDDKDFDLSVGVGIVQNLNETSSEHECVAFAQNDAMKSIDIEKNVNKGLAILASLTIPQYVQVVNNVKDLEERDKWSELTLAVCKGPNYNSIGEMIEAHSVYLPKAKQKGCEDWRLLPYPVAGEVNGLPMFRGLAVATNGVHVAIETSGGSLIFGHVGWFVVDKEEKCRDVKVLFAPLAEFRISSTVKQQLSELESLFNNL